MQTKTACVALPEEQAAQMFQPIDNHNLNARNLLFGLRPLKERLAGPEAGKRGLAVFQERVGYDVFYSGAECRDPHGGEQESADAAALVVVQYHDGDFRFQRIIGVAPAACATQSRELAGRIEKRPYHVVLWVLLDQAVQHFIADHFPGVCPEAMVACFGLEASVGFRHQGAVFLDQRA